MNASYRHLYRTPTRRLARRTLNPPRAAAETELPMRDLPRWIIGDCPHTGREIAVFLGNDTCPPFAVEFMPRADRACLIALDSAIATYRFDTPFAEPSHIAI